MRLLGRLALRQQLASAQEDAARDGLPRRRWADVMIAAGTAGLVLMLVLAYYAWPRDRSLLIEATTQSAQLSFGADATWRMPGARVCRIGPPRRAAPVPAPVPAPDTAAGTATRSGAETGADAACPPGAELDRSVTRVAWQAGARLAFERRGEAAPVIRVISAAGSTLPDTLPVPSPTTAPASAGVALADGDLLLPPGFGPFQALGKVRLGGDGARDGLLLSGRYQWRETLLFRHRPEQLGNSALSAGDILRIASGSCARPGSRPDPQDAAPDDTLGGPVENLLIYPAPPDTGGFQALVSAAQDRRDGPDGTGGALGMCIRRFGFAETFVQPKLSLRILSDPMTYAIGLFLSFAITVFPATLGVIDLRRAQRARRALPPVGGASPESPPETAPETTPASPPGSPPAPASGSEPAPAPDADPPRT